MYFRKDCQGRHAAQKKSSCRECKVLTYALQLLLDRHLLSTNKRVDGCADSHIDVAAADKLSQVHTCTGFCHADHRLQMSDGDGVGACGKRFSSEIGIQPRELVLIEVMQLGLDSLASVLDVLSQHVLRDDLEKEISVNQSPMLGEEGILTSASSEVATLTSSMAESKSG